MGIVCEMRGITKKFPGVVANSSVDFQLEKGNVHALLGENGAGKTTLMNILYGLYQPDEGQITINNQVVHIKNPHTAIALGIGMVHQHFQLVPRFTVAENFQLGMSTSHPPILENYRQLVDKICKFSAQYNLPVDPERPVWQLSVGEQQRVEILKSLYRGAEILILDEPTAVLTPQEVEELERVISRLTLMGKSIIFITHKLEEVMKMTRRITVMRDGKVIGTLNTAEASREEVARMMVGREINTPKVQKSASGSTILEIKSLQVISDRGLPAIKNLSLEVKTGEILGIAGVDGNGQNELEEAIIGLRGVKAGQIILNKVDITHLPVYNRRKNGLAYIPSDRYKRGIIANFSISENLILGQHRNTNFDKQKGILDLNAISQNAMRLVHDFQIRTPGIKALGGKLSGGNAQRLILAREIDKTPTVILACQPTRGLDVGAIENVHTRLLAQRKRGAGILLVSTELEEILALSDRIAVLYEGEIMGIFDREEAKVETLGLLMAGATSTGRC